MQNIEIILLEYINVCFTNFDINSSESIIKCLKAKKYDSFSHFGKCAMWLTM
jgi:hypothetical protein